jgi:hypothetical protein
MPLCLCVCACVCVCVCVCVYARHTQLVGPGTHEQAGRRGPCRMRWSGNGRAGGAQQHGWRHGGGATPGALHLEAPARLEAWAPTHGALACRKLSPHTASRHLSAAVYLEEGGYRCSVLPSILAPRVMIVLRKCTCDANLLVSVRPLRSAKWGEVVY